jgi:hypothetical protein
VGGYAPVESGLKSANNQVKTMKVNMLVLFVAVLAGHESQAKAVPVRVVENGGGYGLLRDGRPYSIKGVGGNGSLALLAASGGNSIRTWGAEGLDKTLDEAHKLGLTVAVGIWLGHERHGFDYANVDQVAKQYEETRKIVLKYKDHPAVLLWGIGNEMEGEGGNAAIWSAVNNLAAMVKGIDPDHPTMTVVAEIGGNKVRNLHRLCPAVDIVGINSYAGVPSLPERYRKAGGTKPFIVTEFGPAGMWETKKNDWNVPPELTSTEKAKAYRAGYEATIAAKPLCLGSYAFLWGTKQEATATWFGMLLPDGRRLAAADTMAELWSGRPVANACPVIEGLSVEGPDQVAPGATVRATLKASDPERDPITVRWVLRAEVENYSSGGDNEAAAPEFAKAITESSLDSVRVIMPKDGGGYRLFAYLDDAHGGAAVANVPLFVKGPKRVVLGKATARPLIVYDEAGVKSPYVPTGWMGNTKAMTLNESSDENPHQGKTCLRLDYRAPDQWGGIVWQDPPGDWGNLPGGWDLSGAKTLAFWARGAKGGEVVSFELGLLGKDKPFPDTGRAKKADVTLTADWQQIRIDLSGQDLTRIKSGFVVTVAGQGKPVTVYLDDIAYE